MENTKELKKALSKRNYYTIKDSGMVYLLALILPLLTGMIFAYLSLSIVKAGGVEFPDGTNFITEMFNDSRFMWFAVPFTLLTQVVFFSIYFSYNKINRIQSKSCNLSFKKVNPKTAILSVVVGVVCVLGLICLIEGCFGNMFKTMGLEQSSLMLPLNNVGWYFANLLILGVLPAVCEELLFRGIVFQGLKERFPKGMSILLSGFLFALMHQNIQQFIYPFILGCLLSLVMERTNNLLYPILIHLFNNITTITISYLANIGAIRLSFEISWWFVIVSIIAAAATIALLWLADKFYLRKQSKIEIEKVGTLTQTSPLSIGKFPISLVCGAMISIIMIVINAVG